MLRLRLGCGGAGWSSFRLYALGSVLEDAQLSSGPRVFDVVVGRRRGRDGR